MHTSTFYNQRAPYEKISNGRLGAIKKLLGDYEGRKILDVGCGSGTLGKCLKESIDCNVAGIDVSRDAVFEAQKVLDTAEVCDIEKGIDEKFFRGVEHVVISEVLEHVFSPELLLRDIRIKSDADVVITIPNILFWKNRLTLLFGRFEYEEKGIMDYGHIRFFSWDAFKCMVEKVGYSIDATYHVVPTRGTKIFRNIFPGLFAYQFCVRLVKK